MALKYSRRMRAMFSMEMPLGQTASHSAWFEQSPNRSRSTCVNQGYCYHLESTWGKGAIGQIVGAAWRKIFADIVDTNSFAALTFGNSTP